ncbi:MAG: hypothetical protein MI976_11205 [Pseudomonadales bacterium]|nr:hypothetical protein [Pseudomonadales bacterium]
MKTINSSFLFAAVFLSGCALAAPSNDNLLDDSYDVWSSLDPNTYSGSNIDATKESGEPNHAGNAGGKSVWVKNSKYFAGRQAISITADFDPLLAIYNIPLTSNPDYVDYPDPISIKTFTGAYLLDGDDGVGNSSYIEFEQLELMGPELSNTTGTFIAVDGKNAAEGNFELTFIPLAPVNDDLADATPFTTATDQTIYGYTHNGSLETNEPEIGSDCSDLGGSDSSCYTSVWYKWTAPTDGLLTLKQADDESYFGSLKLSVYTGTNYIDLTAVHDDFGLRGDLEVEQNQLYYIRVGSYNRRYPNVSGLSSTYNDDVLFTEYRSAEFFLNLHFDNVFETDLELAALSTSNLSPVSHKIDYTISNNGYSNVYDGVITFQLPTGVVAFELGSTCSLSVEGIACTLPRIDNGNSHSAMADFKLNVSEEGVYNIIATVSSADVSETLSTNNTKDYQLDASRIQFEVPALGHFWLIALALSLSGIAIRVKR